MHLVGCGVVVVIVVYNLGFNDGHRSFQLGYSPIFQRSLVIHTYRWPQIQVQRDPPLNVGSWWPLCGMVLQLVVRLWCATGTSPSGRYWTLCWVGSIASLWGFWCHAGIEAPFSMVPSPWGWGFFTSHPLFWPSMWKLTSTFFSPSSHLWLPNQSQVRFRSTPRSGPDLRVSHARRWIPCLSIFGWWDPLWAGNPHLAKIRVYDSTGLRKCVCSRSILRKYWVLLGRWEGNKVLETERKSFSCCVQSSLLEGTVFRRLKAFIRSPFVSEEGAQVDCDAASDTVQDLSTPSLTFVCGRLS